MKRICIYCGCSDRIPQNYLDAAYQMGTTLARNDITLIYGAGSTGMMGAVAAGVLESGGKVWGVIPKLFDTPQLAHNNLTHYEVTDTMHARKARMADLADGFIALPGGLGTFEELFEIITWAQIGLHRKPVGLLNTQGYFAPFFALIAQAVQEGFMYSEHDQLFTHSTDPVKLLDSMANHRIPEDLARWVDRES
jgi:uncharacterized protein (TIGR00730 family)